MNEREQIITFLLASCDQKSAVITDLQKKIAELEKWKAENDPILNATARSLEEKPNGKTAPLPESSKAN